MNSDEVKWLKELFEQHKKDQEKYLDAKFQGLDVKLIELKDSVEELTEDIEDVELTCLACLDDEIKKTDKKIIVGSAGAVAVALLLWTAFGTNALSIVLKWLTGIGLP